MYGQVLINAYVIGDRIANARAAKLPQPWSQTTLANVLAGSSALGLDSNKWKSRLKNYESNRSTPDETTLKAIAKALSVEYRWLKNGPADTPVVWSSMPSNAQLVDEDDIEDPTDETDIYTHLVPYWGAVPAGNWEKPANDEELIRISRRVRKKDKVVAVTVRGNSLAPRFQSGDTVAIRLDPTPVEGVITLALNQDNELTLKVLRFIAGQWELHSINPDYGISKADTWSILGHAIHREETDLSGLRG
jgi:phage repressor protein C with HTH and peptisase S24 domain